MRSELGTSKMNATHSAKCGLPPQTNYFSKKLGEEIHALFSPLRSEFQPAVAHWCTSILTSSPQRSLRVFFVRPPPPSHPISNVLSPQTERWRSLPV